ncbi:flagellar L-ring protein precursor FlgH [Thermosulfidibacter takaii ABI70S6]|uniref:Flagellar L-ring protein n=1 Tax=Thermosulfidibacter takaii (strain DSM 17441 / JCM 13301 / NBRC 103674 / ABI70S6) TaxID=1298851 RepID=A0A0S3QSX0_THET7|nr:flagellar basal body L-ring protein FlgH [Thermosulfidibacter takaii]BAT71404.1 flagellar L-ring protein precursor FlgH [Thermosulfidibacter takaii ABI70S6]
MKKRVIITFLSALVVGCATSSNQVKVDRVYKNDAFKQKIARQKSYASSGSLWVDNYFYSDIRARQVGDIVTILVREYASSKDYGTTQSEKSTSFSSIIKSLFGLKDDVSHLTGLNDPTTLLDASGSAKFKGKGQIEQTSSLQTKVTAVVVDVLPNGNLVVEGKRTIVVNGEKKIIGVRGIVRPQDIGPDNTVSSEALADAEIVYEGKGIVSRSQSPGLFTKLLLWLWPLI